MSKVTRSLMGLGAYELHFEGRPELLDKFVVGHHLLIDRGRERWHTGVITEPARIEGGHIIVSGPGLEWWLGTDDKDGALRSPQTFVNLRTDQIVDNLLFREDGTRALNPGTLNQGNQIDSFSVRWETCRRAIRRLAGATRTEYRVNPDGTFDWAGNSDLFADRDIVLATEAKTVTDLTYESSAFEVAGRVVVLGKGAGDSIIVREATTELPAAWRDWNDGAFQRDFLVDSPVTSAEEAEMIAFAQSELRGEMWRTATAILSSEDLLADLDVGDRAWAYKRHVLEDPTAEVVWGRRTYPAIQMRVGEIEANVSRGWRVFLRHPDGTTEELTNHHVFDAPRVQVTLTSDPEAFFRDVGDDPEPRPDDEGDTMPPKAPAGLTITNTKYKDFGGNQRARLHFEWTAVTENEDDSPITDLARYVVRYRRVTQNPDEAWQTVEAQASETTAAAEDLSVGFTWEAQVRAEDDSNNTSAWIPVPPANTLAGVDTTPPPQPKAPVANGGIEILFVEWERKDASDNVMPPDVRWYEVHAAGTDNFTPTTATLMGEVAGTVASFPVTEGTWYARLIAVDYANNRSVASPTSNATEVVTIEEMQLGDNSVDGQHIADGAMEERHFGDDVVSARALVIGNFDNLAEDPGFENEPNAPTDGGTNPAQSWDAPISSGSGPRWSIVSDPTNARTGGKVIRRAANGTSGDQWTFNRNIVDCRPGDEFYIEAYFKGTGGANGQVRIGIAWLNSSGGLITTTNLSTNTPGTTYLLLQGRVTAPNNAVWAALRITTNNTTGTVYCGDVYWKRVVVTAFLADAAIITAKIADLAVGTGKMENLAVTTGKIANLAVTDGKVLNLTASKITAGNITATMTITSGLFRTNSGSDRVEISNEGVLIFKGNQRSHLLDPASFHLFVRVGDVEGLNSLNWETPGGAVIGRVATTRHGGTDDRLMTKLFNHSTGQQLCELRMMRDRGVQGERWNISDLGRFTQHGLVYSNGSRFTFTNYGASSSSARSYSWAWPSEAPIPDPFITLSDMTGTSTQHCWAASKSRTGATFQVRNHNNDHHGGPSGNVTVSFVPMAVE